MNDTQIPKQKILNAMDLMATIIIEELKQTSAKSEDELITLFLNSTQGKMLYNDSTKLWTTSPS